MSNEKSSGNTPREKSGRFRCLRDKFNPWLNTSAAAAEDLQLLDDIQLTPNINGLLESLDKQDEELFDSSETTSLSNLSTNTSQKVRPLFKGPLSATTKAPPVSARLARPSPGMSQMNKSFVAPSTPRTALAEKKAVKRTQLLKKATGKKK